MKIFLYLLGMVLILYAVTLYYENEREKSFFKRDLEQAGDQLVYEINDDSMNAENAIKTAQKNNSTLLDAVSGAIQNDVRRARDDVRGAVKLRQ